MTLELPRRTILGGIVGLLATPLILRHPSMGKLVSGGISPRIFYVNHIVRCAADIRDAEDLFIREMGERLRKEFEHFVLYGGPDPFGGPRPSSPFEGLMGLVSTKETDT